MRFRLLLAALSLCPLLASSAAAATFRAGVAAVDISPTAFPRLIAGGFLEKRGHQLADPLFVRAFVLDDGATQIAIAIVDTCMMEQTLIDEAKAQASQRCGIPIDRILVSATHTHSAPAAMGCLGTRQDTEYAAFLTPKIAEAIVAAHAARQPARLGWGSVDDWEHTHNRRWIRLPGKEIVDPFGQASGRAHMHPGYLSADVVGPSGPVDPQLSVLALQTLEGQPLGVLANYSQHYFGAAATSSDYYGPFCRHLAAELGQPGEGNGPFVCALSQGTSGDLMWMDYGAAKKEMALDDYAAAVAKSAVKALQSVRYVDHAPLAMIEKTLELAYRVPDAERLAWARPIAAQIEDDLPKNKEEVYAREALILHERQTAPVKLQAIRIGDLSIASLPNEVYALTGLKLRAASPFGTHFNIELGNGATGYIPPPEQHTLGGYTTWPARTAGLKVAAEPRMVAALSDGLAELAGRPALSTAAAPGPYTSEVLASGPVAYYRCDDFQNGLANERGTPARLVGGHALYLPGAGAGLGYGDECALQASAFAAPPAINRSVHLAGGHIELSEVKAGPAFTVAMWFWLGHSSGASERSGSLVGDVFVRQNAAHHVHLASGDQVSAEIGAADDWHFAVLVQDQGNLRVHIDGGAQPVLVLPAESTAETLVLGRGLEGKLDEITVWDRALEPALITRLWDRAQAKAP